MHHRILDKNSTKDVAGLFASAFSSSEGEKEGRLVGDLASRLALKIDNKDVICFGTCDEKESIIGVIFFTRLQFDQAIQVYMLAPVAVGTKHQGKGVGKALITYGLDDLKNRSVTVVVTYGDPSFYSKVGFQHLPEQTIKAPLKLSMPEGWLGQSLTGGPIPTIDGRPICAEDFDDPVYW